MSNFNQKICENEEVVSNFEKPIETTSSTIFFETLLEEINKNTLKNKFELRIEQYQNLLEAENAGRGFLEALFDTAKKYTAIQPLGQAKYNPLNVYFLIDSKKNINTIRQKLQIVDTTSPSVSARDFDQEIQDIQKLAIENIETAKQTASDKINDSRNSTQDQIDILKSTQKTSKQNNDALATSQIEDSKQEIQKIDQEIASATTRKIKIEGLIAKADTNAGMRKLQSKATPTLPFQITTLETLINNKNNEKRALKLFIIQLQKTLNPTSSTDTTDDAIRNLKNTLRTSEQRIKASIKASLDVDIKKYKKEEEEGIKAIKSDKGLHTKDKAVSDSAFNSDGSFSDGTGERAKALLADGLKAGYMNGRPFITLEELIRKSLRGDKTASDRNFGIDQLDSTIKLETAHNNLIALIKKLNLDTLIRYYTPKDAELAIEREKKNGMWGLGDRWVGRRWDSIKGGMAGISGADKIGM